MALKCRTLDAGCVIHAISSRCRHSQFDELKECAPIVRTEYVLVQSAATWQEVEWKEDLCGQQA